LLSTSSPLHILCWLVVFSCRGCCFPFFCTCALSFALPFIILSSFSHLLKYILQVSKQNNRALSIPAVGGSLTQSAKTVTMACFSPDQRYLLYITNLGSQLYDFTTKASHPISNSFNSVHVIASSGCFSSDGEKLLVCEVPVFVYSVKEKRVLSELAFSARWAVFAPDRDDVIIAASRWQQVVQWWTVDGRLLLSVYLKELPRSISISPSKERILISDKFGFSYILAPYRNEDKRNSSQFVSRAPTIPFNPFVDRRPDVALTLAAVFKKNLDRKILQDQVENLWASQYKPPLAQHSERWVDLLKPDEDAAARPDTENTSRKGNDWFSPKEEAKAFLSALTDELLGIGSEANDETRHNAFSVILQSYAKKFAEAQHFGMELFE